MSSPGALSGISGIVLVAGLSRRAAPRNKLLVQCNGTTVGRATTAAMCGAGFDEVVVVTGHERERIEAALSGLPVRFTFAPDFALGMGHSLAAGIRSASKDARAFAITPGDLPFLTAVLIGRIAAEFIARDERDNIVPLAGGERGHPVVLRAGLRAKLESLHGDSGARRLIDESDEKARSFFFEVGDPAILRDVDSGEIGFDASDTFPT